MKMQNKKLIILILSSSKQHYEMLENTIRETWFNYRNNEVEIIFYKDDLKRYVNQSEPLLENNTLFLPCKDGFNTLGEKTLKAFQWVCENYNFDYIYRSNLGAYVNVDKMINFLKDKPNNNFYCGIKGYDNYYVKDGVNFASGSGYFLSKDLVELVNNNQNEWKHNIVDDVALGYIMRNFNIEIDNSAKRMNICDGEVYFDKGDGNVQYIEQNEIYHVRLRSSNRNKDVNSMIELYKNKY